MQSNVLILTYWSYRDPLIQSYTLPYLRIIRTHLDAGSKLVLFTLEKNLPTRVEETLIRQELLRNGIEWKYRRYFPFGMRAALSWFGTLLILRRWIQRNVNVTVHCWGTPAGAAGYLLTLFSRCRLVIDSYEPHAEAMVENGTWTRSSIAFRLLFALEKLQTKRATFLIAANAGMRSYAREKYNLNVDMLVKPACVNLNQFVLTPGKDPALVKDLGLTGKRVAVYAGKLGGIYLDREVFDFLKQAHDRWGDQFRALLLTSHSDEEIDSFCEGARLDRSVVITRYVSHPDVPRYLALADFALTPVKPVPTKRYCTPIKDGEYWAMGLPVVITDGISDDAEIIRSEQIGAVLKTLDQQAYRTALATLENLLAQPREELQLRIRKVAARYRSFDIAEQAYQKVYSR